MLIFPAIDIKGGECVRLSQGEFSTAQRVAADALETAFSFKEAGCTWVHMVDLDGAVQGKRVNEALFLRVARESGLEVQLGGGIRSMADISFYLEHGIRRVILGSAAVSKPALVGEALRVFGADAVALGIDAKRGMVAAKGWLELSEISYLDLARQMERHGVKTVIFTDIGRDGMLSGPNLEQLAALRDAVGCDIIASGGVSSNADIRQLARAGMQGAICGKSIYSGALSLAQAVRDGKEFGKNECV
ncbi:MAG: 1-(5-phosphoribosyl)-5-[(5-phosphoribosylamino)methylideneamino]imidazole-4-carboxamide isomerase [Oscillospiraceae bacterium]|nr:1-(5-phosphoribosyl)-5-[(5-phosphoribosylamino)methylideneamino]imidazole-4-carboxamide isomerase [Oscillospiraceae bacterium]